MCSPTFIEIWQQDINNKQLLDRDLNTFGSRVNYLFPKSKSMYTINTNTKINKSEKIIYDTTNLRNINIENNLFLITTPIDSDVITTDQIKKLEQDKYSINQQLYRTYHTKEVNSLCYPNIDRQVWDNTTKAFYNTIDNRNLSIKQSQQ